MSTIDNRVVAMDFDGAKFGSGVTNTLSMLDRLKAALHLPGASKGLQDISAAAGQFNSAPMEQGANRIAGSFTAMQAVAFGALASIGQKAIAIGGQVASAFTIDPVKQGFQEYETNMTSIQTILSNTKAAGTGLTEVNAALDEMNHYSDQTIYNFSEMAKNVGTFTAAGVDLDTATGSIKGIANLAALSGSNSQQAAGAMYQLSQEIAAGKVTLMGWNSVVNAGMGGSVFQRALAETAVAMGKIDKSALTLEGDMKNVKISGESFRDSISAEGGGESWLTSDVLTNTLQQFTGDLNEAELAAQGFSAAQIKAIQDQAAMAVGAATEVKTFTGLMDTLKEGVASGWSQTFRILVGDFEESKELFTSISNAVGGFFGRISEARNEMLTGWKEMGGRDELLEGLSLALGLLLAPLDRIGKAFRQIFPATSARDLLQMTRAFTAFMEEIQFSSETLDRIRRTAAGFFAILGIGWEVLKAVTRFLAQMFLGITEGDQGILRFTASIGDFLVGLHEAIKNGEGLTKFFDKLRDAIFKIINPIRDAGQSFGMLVEKFDMGGFGESLGKLITGLLSIGEGADKAGGGVSKIKEAFSGFLSFFAGMGRAIANFLKPVTDAIAGVFGDFDFDKVMEAFQTGALVGIAFFLKQIGGMFNGFSLFGNDMGFVQRIRQGLDSITGTLSAMQANLKASMLLKIAAAIALLAVSVVLLASVDAEGLARATAALTVMFIQLGAAMAAFQKIGSIASIAKLNLMGAALILLGAAILVLTASVKLLSQLSWSELGRGLGSLAIMVALLIAMSRGMDKSRGAVLRSAAALVIMAFAIKSLVDVVKELGSLDLVTLAKGLAGIAILLAALGTFSRVADTGLREGAGLLLMAYGVKLLAEAMVTMKSVGWEDIGKGMVVMAVGITIIGEALDKMPITALLKALALAKVAEAFLAITVVFKDLATIPWENIAKGMAMLAGTLGLVILAMKLMPSGPAGALASLALTTVLEGLQKIAPAMKALAGMSWEQIARSLVVLGGALGILVIAINMMETSVRGAAALVIVVSALALLVPILMALGAMSIPAIVTALVALAGVFIVLAVAGNILRPVVPVLMALGIAVALIGAAMALAGAGVFLFALGLTALGAAGAVATAGIVAFFAGLIGLIPMVVEQLGLALVAFLRVIGNSGAELVTALSVILISILQAIQNATPEIGQTFLVLLFTLLHVIEQALPRLIQAGFNILIAFLQGIANNIGRVVDVATDIVVNFLNGISDNIGDIIQAGIDLIIDFVEGLAQGIRDNAERMGEAGVDLATAIIEGMIRGLGAGAMRVVNKVKGLAGDALNAAKDFLGINSPSRKFAEIGMGVDEGMAKGIGDYAYLVTGATRSMGSDVVSTMGKTIAGLGDAIDKSMTDDFHPVITPVLDLSSVQKDASGIGSIFAQTPLDVSSSYSGAANASNGYLQNREVIQEQAAAKTTETISFVQNNHSPKALSAIEIYRNTNNQLSQARGALKKPGVNTG